MPNLRRSPPADRSDDRSLHTPNNPVHYNSDSALHTALNTSSFDIQDDINYFNITKRLKRNHDETVDKQPTSFTEMVSLFNSKFEAMNNTLHYISLQNQTIQKTVENMSHKHEQLLSKINSLELENMECKNRVSQLERKIDFLENKCIVTTLEVRNLPKHKEETKEELITTIKKLSSFLGVPTPIEEKEIRDVYRTKSESIVVDFTTSLRKESLIQHYKSYNRNKREHKEPPFNSGHLNITGAPRSIFISEYLSSKVRRLFYLARENVKSNLLAAAWTSHGKIYVKKQEGSPPVRISDETALVKASQ